MNQKLSPAMSKLLNQCAAEPLPGHRYCANRTVKALERRGLVAYRYERGEYPWKARVADFCLTEKGKAALLPGLNDFMAAMHEYAAMVLDYQFQDGLTAFLAALAEFAASSWTCPGCKVEQEEDTGCGDCGRCADCCDCHEAAETEPAAYRDCLNWREELFHSLNRHA